MSDLSLSEKQTLLEQSKEKVEQSKKLIEKSKSDFEKSLLRSYIDRITLMIQNIERSLL